MDLESLKNFNDYLECVSLGINATLSAYVLIKLNFRLDQSAYIVIVIYLICMTMRVANNLIDHPIVAVIWPISSNLIWLVLFYFVFEMSMVQAKVTSSSHTEYQQIVKNIRRERSIVIASQMITYIIPTTIIQYFISEQIERAK